MPWQLFAEALTKKNAEQKDGPELSIDEAYAYLVHRTARLLRYHFLQMAERNGLDLTPEQWFVLNRLRRREGQGQTELADSIFKDRANITRILNSMEKKRLVERRRTPEDKRVYRIYLTREGRRVHDALAAIARQERGQVYRGLTSADHRELKRILDIMDQNIIDSMEI